MEQAFPVKYDARYAKDLLGEEGILKEMNSKNHHLFSLAHSPDPIGLIFSIINQYMGYATFADKGQVIHVIPAKSSKAIPYFQGTEKYSMLFCGAVNWLGHLISDMVGSSSTRHAGKTRRGAGIPIPFYELFLSCDFGNLDGKTFANTMVKVFEEGYDLRFGVAMAVPVLLNELMIKVIWTIRQRFGKKKPWNECYPSNKHADLRIMILVGTSTLCLVDGTDAVAHGIVKGNVVSFICHLNLIGWARLAMLILKELRIRYGPVIEATINRYMSEMLQVLKTASEKQQIVEFYGRLEIYDQHLSMLFKEFVSEIEEEYKLIYLEMDATFDENRSRKERADHSIELARASGVADEKVIKSRKELDDFFS